MTPLSGNRAAGTAGAGSGAVLEAPALVSGLDDLAMMGQAVEQGCGHLGVAEDGWPFAEGKKRNARSCASNTISWLSRGKIWTSCMRL